jgi:uncharacterized protein involved in outer membrane biogenesis
MKATPFYRRYPLLSALLLLLASAAVLLTVALPRLDLGDLRLRLTRELSQLLQQPVRMEALHLTYRQGLAIDIRNLGIGDEQNPQIRIPQVTGVLRLKPLLDGELLLDRVVLSGPQFTITLPERTATGNGEAASALAGKLFKRFGLSLLTIRQAQLELKQEQARPRTSPSRIENLNLVLRGWESEQSGYLVVSGELPEQAGRFIVETELPPPAQLANWRRLPLTVTAELKQLSRELLPERSAQYLPERIDATLRLDGALASGVAFSGQLTGSESGKQLLKAEGRWTSSQQTERLQNLRMILHDMPLTGELQISRTAADRHWQGRLSTENIPLPPLLKLLNVPQLDKLTAGTLTSATAHFSSRDRRDGATTNAPPFQYRAQLRLDNGRWALNDTEHLERISLEARLDNQTLELSNGTLQLREQDLSFHGQIHNWQDAPLFALEITARPGIAALRRFLPVALPETLVLDGPVPAALSIEGSRESMRGELQVNLDDLHAQFAPLFIKQAKQQGRLHLKGSWRPGRIDIEQGTLALAETQLAGSAAIPLGDSKRAVRLQLRDINLSALRRHSPLLQRLAAEGGLSLELQHLGSGKFQGELKLDQVGAHLTWMLGDLNSASGAVRFDQQGLDFAKLDARLGRSPVQVDGTLRDWNNFLLDLRVRSQAMRARDLIFANQDMILNDLDGRLLINKGGILFDPVRVRLESGTDATVYGYVRDFSAPDTSLEIDSFQHADILEIIKLFTGPPKKKPEKSTVKGKPIRILARVAQGTVGGLQFHDAEGTIVSRPGLFTLYPLRFRHKDGFCLSRVEYEQGRLKVSGHLEDFDAATVHSEVLKAQGLVTGQLRGDFYLEGNGTGDSFWASSRGGAHLEIRNGALRKFRGLARIFSLLNVSQLFELKLPDMDRKGMPFSLLTASVSLEDGRLATENLQIKSNAMNMSLIGSRSFVDNTIDVTVGVKPLRTVDKIITAIPVAGWLLAGEEKALLTAHFKVEGPANDPVVTAIPASSLSKTVLGIVKRTLGLPGTLVTDPDKLFAPGRENGRPAKPQGGEQLNR